MGVVNWMRRIGGDGVVKEQHAKLERQWAEAQERLKHATVQFSISAEERCRRLWARIEAKK